MVVVIGIVIYKNVIEFVVGFDFCVEVLIFSNGNGIGGFGIFKKCGCIGIR